MMLTRKQNRKTTATAGTANKLLANARKRQHQKVRELLHGPSIQPKLDLGKPDDIYEQEADQVADKVMRMPESGQVGAQGSSTPLPPPGNIGQNEQARRIIQRKEDPKEEQEEPVQAKRESPPAMVVTSGLSAGIRTLIGHGQPLSGPTRGFFENLFGTDFSQVRVHTGVEAFGLASSINARAFTYGDNIFFGRDEYAPQSIEGRRLIAHELTHVAQQLGRPASIQRKGEVDIGVSVPDTGEVYNPRYRYPWQNPHLRKTIYPYRLKKLQEFLLTYKEIDLWKSANAGDLDLDEIAGEIKRERESASTALKEAKSAFYKAKSEFKIHRRGRKAFFSQRDVRELRRQRERLKRDKKALSLKVRKLASSVRWYQIKAPEHVRRLKQETHLEAETSKLSKIEIQLEQVTHVYNERVAPYKEKADILAEREKRSRMEYRERAAEYKEIPTLGRRAKISKATAVKWELLKYKRLLEILNHDALLAAVLDRFDTDPGFTRYPKWLRYMVIHFSGMRYKSAHGSWASPQKLLQILKREQVREKMKDASEEAVAKQSEKAVEVLEKERSSEKRKKKISEINAQIYKLTLPRKIEVKVFQKDPLLKERFKRLRKLERERDTLAGVIVEGGVNDTAKSLRRKQTERLDRIEDEIELVEHRIGAKRLKDIRRRIRSAEQVRRRALLKYQIKTSIARIGELTDFQALGRLKAMKKQFPPWVWKEIVKHTRLRLGVKDVDWESLTKAEKRAKGGKDPVTRRWRAIMSEWRKNITLWRKKQRDDLSLVVTRAVCNELAEHIQAVRGVSPKGGLTDKAKWYLEQASGQPATRYFRRPVSDTDFASGASIFWLGWRKKQPHKWSIARPLPGVEFRTEGGKNIYDGLFDSAEGWTYHVGQEIYRTSTGVCPCGATDASTPNVLIEWLSWTHEATVVEVAKMGAVKKVITFETGEIGLGTRRYNSLVNKWNIFVGFVPAGAMPKGGWMPQIKRK